MHNVDSHPLLINCTFSANSALHGAGGMNNEWSSPTLINCTFAGNLSTHAGGMLNTCSNPTLTNCTFSGNATYSGRNSAMWNYACSPTLVNCIVWTDSGSEIFGPAVITYSNVQGGWQGQGNIDVDPCFVSLGYWADANDPNITVDPRDPNAVWVNGDYHLLPHSPCINAGDPNYIAEPNETDLDGKPRVIAGRIDMGAYEFNHIPVADAGPNQTVYAWIDEIAGVTLDGSGSYDPDGQPLSYLWSWTVDGNTMTEISSDGDGIINLLDFAVFAAQYPQTENPLLRLSIMAQAWLTTPPSPHWNPKCDIGPTGATVTIELPIGQHVIELIVNDGIDDSEPDYVDVNVVAPLEANLRMLPRVINRYSRMRRIMAFVRLPEGITKDEIDRNEPLMLYPAGSEEGITAMRQRQPPPRRRRW